MKKYLYILGFATALLPMVSALGSNRTELSSDNFLMAGKSSLSQQNVMMATYPITYTVQSNFPTTDDFLYAKVNSISFFRSTSASGQCTGQERTLGLQNNKYWRAGVIRIGGYAAGTVLSRNISVNTDAIGKAANSLGFILSRGACIELKILYNTGNISTPNNKIVITSSNSIDNPPFTLGNLNVSSGVVTSGTPENNHLDITSKGVLEYYDGTTHIINLRLLSGTNKTITIKNQGYGDLTSFSFLPLPSAAFASLFSNNTCNTTLSSGAQCTISYTGGSSGDGYLKAAFSNGTQAEKILPFNIQDPGKAKAWGKNNYGQLGNGTKIDSLTPVDISTLSGVVQISVGYLHTCALFNYGGVKCWGYNGSGQLGTGNKVNSATPVDVSTLSSGVVQISLGYFHTCALLNNGTMKCWGYNDSGQLGTGNRVSSSTPVDVSTLSSRVVQISSGYFHTCALLDNGAMKCWGNNNSGQLGNGTTDNSATPVDVSTLSSGVVQISSGYFHTCAILDNGAMKCWGDNDSGQLGNGTAVNSSTPVDVSTLSSRVVQITSGYFHTCAILDNGAIKCWGRNDSGQLGNGTTVDSLTPVDVSTPSSAVVQITSGAYHACALLDNGAIECWGRNDSGQLGNGTTANSSTPAAVTGLTGVKHIPYSAGTSLSTFAIL